MKLLAQFKTPGLAKTLSVVVRLRWPNATILCVDTEDSLVEMATSAEAILLDEVSTHPARFELMRRLRAVFDGAIVVFACEPDEEEMLSSLEAGADDYLPTSVTPARLIARLSAVLRRLAATGARAQPASGFGPLRINEDTHEVYFRERELHLSSTEFTLLCELSRASGAVLTNEALNRVVGNYPQALWGDCLRKHVERLRKKLSATGDESVQIINVRGVGYKLKRVG